MNYNEKLEELKYNDVVYLQKKAEGASELTLGKILGKAAERGIEKMIKDIKSVVSIEEKLAPEVDKFSKIDCIITFTDGSKMYCPVVKDLWWQTSQMDRLQAFYYKIKLWKAQGRTIPNYVYLVHADLDGTLSKVHRPNTVRAKEIQTILKELVDEGFIMDMNRFMPVINKKNELIQKR